MTGTFRTGDILSIVPVELCNVRVGDVVVFNAPEKELKKREIVHRVIKKSAGLLIARGDSSKPGTYNMVTEDLLIGRVISRLRNNRASRICGGSMGCIKGSLLNLWWNFKRYAGIVLNKPYCILKVSNIVPVIWKPHITRVLINSNKGSLIQFIHNRHVVARSWPELNKFECRKPWDLVIGDCFPDTCNTAGQ